MEEQIKGIGYDGKMWLLIDEVTQISVKVGQVLTDFRGGKDVARDGRAPHKPSSTGHVQTSAGGEFYPGVYGCKWIKI